MATKGVEDYYKALETRFRPPPSEAFAKFNAIRYLVEDYKNRRSITEFLATLESYVKAYGQGPMDRDDIKFEMVIYTWIYLELVLRETVDKPLLRISLEQFCNTLLRK
jgi:hypothetical protein